MHKIEFYLEMHAESGIGRVDAIFPIVNPIGHVTGAA